LASVGMAACGGGGGGGTTNPPPTSTFTSVSLAPGSATLIVTTTQQINATALDQNGTAMSGATFNFQSSAPNIASVTSGGLVTGVALGSASITATGTIGGVSKTAQASITVTVPGTTANVNAGEDLKFTPTRVDIVAGGTVSWQIGGTDHNVTFDGGPGSPQNIPLTHSTTVSRTFATAGTFAYQCTVHSGMNGSVVVH